MSRIQNILDKAEREARRCAPAGVARDRAAAARVAGHGAVPMPIESRRRAANPPPAGVSATSCRARRPRDAPHRAAPAARRRRESKLHRAPQPAARCRPRAEVARRGAVPPLRTRLAHAEGASNLRTVLVTSPQKGEGKSITSANLALTMAQELQRRVVIVEADLRKPSLQQLFGLPAGPGLAEYLSGAAELKDVMQFLPDHNLTVIHAGRRAGQPGRAARLDRDAAAARQLRTRFDRVILDTPPVLPLADVAVLAPLVDGALMVVRAGVTPKPAIENALRAFDSSRLLGIVLNESGLEQDYRYEATKH